MYQRALKHKDKWILGLAIALGAVLLVVIVALLIDVANRDWGWFRSAFSSRHFAST